MPSVTPVLALGGNSATGNTGVVGSALEVQEASGADGVSLGTVSGEVDGVGHRPSDDVGVCFGIG
jgi:hypothetical protein